MLLCALFALTIGVGQAHADARAGTALGLAATAKASATAPIQTHSAEIIQKPASSAVSIIWDDDCAQDPDCAPANNALHHWIDTGSVNVLALIADSSNPNSAALLKVWETYYGHSTIPIGAYQGSGVGNGSGASGSTWAAATVTQFNAGDSRTNYADCVAVYRRALASAASGSVNIVSTGFATCLLPLIQSSADGISSLTGAQLVQQKVAGLYLMGGDYTTGTEFNMTSDAAEWSTFFATWTSQNGYPPIYLNGFTPGNSITTGMPAWFPASHPGAFAFSTYGTTTRPSWDILSLYQAIFGRTDFTASANGLNVVNSSTGANSWSSGTAAGHYYLTLTNAAAYYAALLDGQTYAGANWYFPQQAAGTLTGPGFQCSAVLSGCVMSTLSIGQLGTSTVGTVYGTLSFKKRFNAWVGSQGGIAFSGGAIIGSEDADKFEIKSSGDGNLSMLIFGQKAATVPAFKFSGTTIKARLGDDSADAPVTTGPLTVSNSLNSPFTTIASFLDPALTVGNAAEIDVGYAASANNWMGLGFHLEASGSASNYGRLSFYGTGDIFRWYPSGLTQQPSGLTVSTLPTCTTTTKGAASWVSDANAPAYLATVSGGGSTVVPVFCNGVNWVAH